MRYWGLTAALLFAACGAHAAVEKKDRVAVVVVELATHAAPEKKFFYNFIEAAGMAETNNRIKPLYKKVVVLNGADATLKKFYQTLANEIADSSVKAIDTFINLHGSDGEVLFREGRVATKTIRDALVAMKGASKKLRLLNSTACYGASHIVDWLGAGFKVASGAKRVNANGAHDFPTLLKAWGGGETYSQAQEKGNESRWIKFYDEMAAKWGLSDVDSYKVVEGKSDLTISSDVP